MSLMSSAIPQCTFLTTPYGAVPMLVISNRNFVETLQRPCPKHKTKIILHKRPDSSAIVVKIYNRLWLMLLVRHAKSLFGKKWFDCGHRRFYGGGNREILMGRRKTSTPLIRTKAAHLRHVSWKRAVHF